jgi:release factor glutamine methyltransferase
VGAALETGRRALASVSETAGLDAQALLARASGADRGWLLAHPEAALEPGQAAGFLADLARCARGEPLPYVLGEWEFSGRSFLLSPDVLIPRPETELLVEAALDFIRTRGIRRAADVGTGSGCVGVTLVAEAPDLVVLATDLSSAALEMARRNALRHGVEDRFHAAQMDLLTSADGGFPLVCANLPYVPSGTLAGLPVGRREPRLALDGGLDGLRLIRRLLADLPRALASQGTALLEIGHSHGASALEVLREAAPSFRGSVLKDLAGLERVLVVERDGA